MPAKPTQMGKFLPSGDLPSGEKTDVYCNRHVQTIYSVGEKRFRVSVGDK